MTFERILANQRRTAAELIRGLGSELKPGRPFLAVLRSELGRNKGFGSRDRRLYREIIFSWLRHREWYDRLEAGDPGSAMDLLIALAPDVPELAQLQAAIGCPGGVAGSDWPELRQNLDRLVPRLAPDISELLPAWFRTHCPALFEEDEIFIQLQRPPLWLRAQRGTAADLVHELARASFKAAAAAHLPWAVKVIERVDLEGEAIVTSGRAEIQDAGSQAVLAMAAPEPGGHWLDFCAGAGGKSLQLARLLGSSGRVTSHDIRRDALMELKRRMIRAMAKNIVIEPVLPEPGTAFFDGVLVDAPCSASGTWRRHPFLRHQLNRETVRRRAGEQVELLAGGAAYVRPGGRLIYATCSLSREENEDVVAAFLKAGSEFALEEPAWLPGLPRSRPPWVTLMPSFLDSDGYFVACMRRRK